MSEQPYNYRIYEILNEQYQFNYQRTHDIESKAVNVVLFSGILLGLEFNLVSNFYNSALMNIGNFIYYLIAINSSFFISAILLGIFALIEFRYDGDADIIPIIETCNEEYDIISQISNVVPIISVKMKQKDKQNEIKYRFLKSSFMLFLFGVIIATILFYQILRTIFLL